MSKEIAKLPKCPNCQFPLYEIELICPSCHTAVESKLPADPLEKQNTLNKYMKMINKHCRKARVVRPVWVVIYIIVFMGIFVAMQYFGDLFLPANYMRSNIYYHSSFMFAELVPGVLLGVPGVCYSLLNSKVPGGVLVQIACNRVLYLIYMLIAVATNWVIANEYIVSRYTRHVETSLEYRLYGIDNSYIIEQARIAYLIIGVVAMLPYLITYILGVQDYQMDVSWRKPKRRRN